MLPVQDWWKVKTGSVEGKNRIKDDGLANSDERRAV